MKPQEEQGLGVGGVCLLASRQCRRNARGSKLPQVTAGLEAEIHNQMLATWCPPNPLTCGHALFFFSRKNGGEVLQQQLYHVQPPGGTDDRGAGDSHGAKLEHLHIHHRQHGGLLT